MHDLETYIEYKPIYDLAEEIKLHMDEGLQYKNLGIADDVHKYMFEFTNIYETFKDFKREDLFNTESMLYKCLGYCGRTESKRGKKRDGMMFTVMLPHEFHNLTHIQKTKIKDELLKIIVPDKSNLIHIGFSIEYANGLYFKILMLDRELYPNGIEVDDIATNDVYKRLYTHQLMSKEEYNSDPSKGYIAIKKGETRGTKVIFRSSKYRAFALSKTKFIQKMNELKQNLIELFVKFIYKVKSYKSHIKKISMQHYDKKINKTIKLTFYNHNKFLWYEYRKKIAINSLVTAVNISFNKILKDDLACDKMPEMYQKINKRVNSLKYARVKNIDIFEQSIKNEIKEYTDIIENKSKEEQLYNFAQKIFGNFLEIVDFEPIFQ